MSTVRIQLRRGLADDWTSADPTLAAGEVGLESDTGKFKFGDGSTAWATLPYALENTLDDYIPLSDLGQPNGVASLNSSGKVPANQLDISELSQDAVNTALVAGTGISKSYDDNANTITLSVNATTSNISEGTNLYFTDERAQDAVNTAIVAGSNVTKSYDDNANTITLSLAGEVSLATSIEAPTAYIDDLNVYETATVQDLTVSGNLTVNGTTTTVNATDLVVTDPLIYIGEDNQANTLDLGLVASFNNGTYQHTGLVKDATDGTWRLFSGVVSEPTTTVDFTTYTKDNLQVGNLDAASATIGDVSNTELQYLNGVTSAIQTQIDSKSPSVNPTFTGTVTLPADTSIGDVSSGELAYVNGVTSAIQTQLNAKAPINSPQFTGTVSGIDKTMVGLGNVDNTTDLGKPVSDATQTALDLKADITDQTFYGTVVLPSTTSIGNVSSTELGYLNGVTDGLQFQLDAKSPIASPTFTGVVVLPSTTSIGDVSNIEIGYLNGVTSGIQTQIDAKASATDLSDHLSDTTSVHGISDTSALATKTYADDAVSTHSSDTTSVHGIADTSALATKTYADDAVSTHSSDTTSVHGITDTSKLVKTDSVSTTLDGALVITGDLTVNGTNFSASATSITIEDNMVQLAHQNAANTVDLGIVVAYNDGAAKHAGFVRDVSDSKWKLFQGVTDEPSTTVNFGQGSLDALAVGALEATTVTPSSGVVFSDGTQTKEGVVSRTPIIQKTDSYTLSALTERDSLIEVNKSTAATITIPLNATVAYPVGTSIDILQTGTGQVSITIASGGTLNCTPSGGSNTAKLRAQWSSATLFKRAENTWVVYGDLTA